MAAWNIPHPSALAPVLGSSMTMIQVLALHGFTHGRAKLRPVVRRPSWLDTDGLADIPWI